MSATTSNTGFPVANFPAVGPVGIYFNGGPGGGIAQVLGDASMWMGGPWIITILAELRVQTQLLQQILGTETTQLSQLRQDAITDMGTLYSSTIAAPVASS